MIRAYVAEDKAALLELLRLNTPQYFARSEEEDFSEYLDKYREDYFVVEENDKIIGSAGINYFEKKMLSRISWDVVHPDFQGKGIGKKLTQYRINLIENNPKINLIQVRTTQLTYQFYEKMGFELEKIEEDFWAKGFDLYQMRMELRSMKH